MSKESYGFPGGRFPLGEMVISTAADEKISRRDIVQGLIQHSDCDWGYLSDDDAAANERALDDDGRLMSVYHDSKGTAFWVITEADRSATTVLLPDDY